MKRAFISLLMIFLSLNILFAGIISSPVSGLSVAKPNPYNRITSIAEDSDGMLWIGTNGDGLFQFDGTNYLRFSATGSEGSVLSSHINSILCDATGRLWIGTQKGINVFDKNTLSFSSYPLDENNMYVRTVLEDPSGRIFIVTAEGLLQFVENNGIFRKVLSFNDKVVKNCFIDENGYLFIIYLKNIEKYNQNFSLVSTTEISSTINETLFDGKNTIFFKDGKKLAAFDTKSMSVVNLQPNLCSINNFRISGMSNFGSDALIFITDNGHYCYYPQFDKLISESDANFPYNRPKGETDINLIFKGKNHLWAATGQGTAIALVKSGNSPYNAIFRTFVPGRISDIFFDGQCAIFLFNRENLIKYNVTTSEYDSYKITEIIGTTEVEESFSLFFDKYSGTILLSGANDIYEIQEQGNGQLKCIHKYYVDKDATISAVTMDKQHRIWASRSEDPNLYYSETNVPGNESSMQKFPVKPDVPRVYISKLLTLKNGNILGAFTDIGLVSIDRDLLDIEYVTLSEKYKNMYIQTLCEDRTGNIWIGTSDVGLFIYNPHTGEVKMPEQFEGKNISSIALDDNGDVLLSTEYTLYRYNSRKDSFESVWVLPEFITDQHLKIYPIANGSNLLYSGNMLFHYNHAESYIVPSSFNIVLTDNNSNVLTVLHSSALNKKSAKIKLPKSQTTLTVVLGSPGLEEFFIQSRFKISGLTNGWQSAYGKLTIPLNNLSYGRHRMDLQLTNIEGNSYSESAKIILHIKRPWYISIPSGIIYLMLLVIFLFIIIKQKEDRQKKMLEAGILRREKEFQEKMNEANVDFFANMSHEFRTPLTIISGAAKSLSSENPAGQVRLQRIIRRNSERMLKLVSQMLDFNKLEHNELALNVVETDAGQLIKDMIEQLSIGAKEKSIVISSSGASEYFPVWIDLDKFEKIMYNLLSNALKFTPVNGEISVTAKILGSDRVLEMFPKEEIINSSDYLVISVADNGIGIPEESLDKIFERFVQLNPSQKNSGTGIGLYFSKVLINLHHGFIKAENNNGAVFTFAIPKDESAYSDEEKSIKQDKHSSIDAKAHLSEYIIPETDTQPSSDTRIMLIDDDVEIIGFLKSILSASYNVLTCFDAMSGYKQIEEFNPDIIISDIMMLDMDGLQFCKMVKENVEICHIPIILLTAKDTVADQIKGLNCGAEAYIVKPFDPEVLLATIKSLLRNRENIRQLLGSATKIEKKDEIAISNRDKALMDKLYTLLEENISNPEMNIVNFAEELGVSRTKLFYKVKSLTGMTPSDFFTQYKLNRAVEYIKEDKYKIASIAEMCGFSSPSHFASLFKKQFGVLPREFLNSLHQEH